MASTSATEREIPNGAVLDCTEANDVGMEGFEPFMVGGIIADANHRGELILPDGMASRVREGQRIVLQSHYVNTSPDSILVQDELQLDVVPEDDVDTWAAPFVHTEPDLDIPTGVSSLDVSCTFDADYTVLFMGGHMHEWGKSYRIVRETETEPEELYEIAEWDPYFRDAPEYADYQSDGGLQVTQGTTFVSTCEWDNDTEGTLGFPAEMCATFGMLYPAKAPIICTGD